jgi:MFS family permease
MDRLGRPTVSRTAGFWLATVVFILVFAVSAAPTPLYGVYQTGWGFSAIVLTAVCAIYALFLLVTLLIFGSVSDHVGRRRVISVALFGNTVVCALFLTAHGVAQLFAARAVQGVAVGLATSALGAALIDLQPEGSGLAPVFTNAGPLWGLAIGGLGASALVQYAPAPTHLVWWLLLGTSFVAALAILTIPETSAAHPNVLASMRPSIGIPREARTTFARTTPIFCAAWALNGFYLSLGPSLAADHSVPRLLSYPQRASDSRPARQPDLGDFHRGLHGLQHPGRARGHCDVTLWSSWHGACVLRNRGRSRGVGVGRSAAAGTRREGSSRTGPGRG